MCVCMHEDAAVSEKVCVCGGGIADRVDLEVSTGGHVVRLWRGDTAASFDPPRVFFVMEASPILMSPNNQTLITYLFIKLPRQCPSFRSVCNCLSGNFFP